MTPIEYPTITVGKHENLVVRVNLASQVLMRRRGLDPNKIVVLIKPDRVRNLDGTITETPNGHPDWLQNTVTLFSCLVAENFIDRDKPYTVNLDQAPTADYWASTIDDFEAVEKVVWKALGKALQGKRKIQAVTPAEPASLAG